jgi:hypothetical protein
MPALHLGWYLYQIMQNVSDSDKSLFRNFGTLPLSFNGEDAVVSDHKDTSIPEKIPSSRENTLSLEDTVSDHEDVSIPEDTAPLGDEDTPSVDVECDRSGNDREDSSLNPESLEEERSQDIHHLDLRSMLRGYVQESMRHLTAQRTPTDQSRSSEGLVDDMRFGRFDLSNSMSTQPIHSFQSSIWSPREGRDSEPEEWRDLVQHQLQHISSQNGTSASHLFVFLGTDSGSDDEYEDEWEPLESAQLDNAIQQSIITDYDPLVGQKCPIVMTEFSVGDRVGKLECGHIFLYDAIREWLTHDARCPICSHRIT